MLIKDKVIISSSLILCLIFINAFINLSIKDKPFWGEFKVDNYECLTSKRSVFFSPDFAFRQPLHAFSKTHCLSNYDLNNLILSERISVVNEESTFHQSQNSKHLFSDQKDYESSAGKSNTWTIILGVVMLFTSFFMIFIAFFQYKKAKVRAKSHAKDKAKVRAELKAEVNKKFYR